MSETHKYRQIHSTMSLPKLLNKFNNTYSLSTRIIFSPQVQVSQLAPTRRKESPDSSLLSCKSKTCCLFSYKFGNLYEQSFIKGIDKILLWVTGCLIFLFFSFTTLQAHEIRPAYLEIQQDSLETNQYHITWKIPMMVDRAPKIMPVYPQDFEVNQTDEQFLPDAYIRYYTGTYDEKLNGKTIAIEGLELTLIDVLLQVSLADETSYTLLLQPDQPQTTIPIEPNSWEVAKLYLILGVEHILLGIDHLLFVLCLLLLVQNWVALIKTVTAFTIAHSITLGLASLELMHLPQAPVEAVIALSIVFLAREYLFFREGKQDSLTVRSPWLVAFAFGLLHGFGFAGALSDIGFPQKNIPLALFTFNVGVEMGQLLFIGGCTLLLWIWKKINITLPKWTWKLMPYAIGGVASYWLIERTLGFF